MHEDRDHVCAQKSTGEVMSHSGDPTKSAQFVLEFQPGNARARAPEEKPQQR
jgi:hypothetical protein